jgi:RNA polymerase sigma factor (TIGR02999 family)
VWQWRTVFNDLQCLKSNRNAIPPPRKRGTIACRHRTTVAGSEQLVPSEGLCGWSERSFETEYMHSVSLRQAAQYFIKCKSPALAALIYAITKTSLTLQLCRDITLQFASNSRDALCGRTHWQYNIWNMPVAVGTQIGPYEITGLLGKGGMGEVYKARDTRLGRNVALKFSGESFSDSFWREARAIAALNHPNICTLYDVGPNYLVMELVEGSSPRGPLQVKDLLQVAIAVCDALDAAHSKGIVHRDLKPGNLLITTKGPKILDFGISVRASADEDADCTQTVNVTEGKIVGTPGYIAPEQFRGGSADARSDIFSLGVVLYELATGKRPFAGDSAAEVIGAVLERDMPPVCNVQPSLPQPLGNVIDVCLAKDPQRGWQSARDILLQLQWIDQQHSRIGTELKTNRRTGMWASLLVAVLGAVLVGIGTGYWWRRRPPTERTVIRLAAMLSDKAATLAGGEMALSPAGRSLVLSAADAQGKTQLWKQRCRKCPACEYGILARRGRAHVLPRSVGSRRQHLNLPNDEAATMTEARPMKEVFLPHGTHETTTLLIKWRHGDATAADELIARVYSELRRLAGHYLRSEQPNNTLQPTALVHELYIRLLGSEAVTWQNRAHFFAVAAQQMRRILIDHARARRAEKRGGGALTLSLADISAVAGSPAQDVLVIHEALTKLEALDRRAAHVVELRFFGGLREKEAAEVLGISVATLKRDWEFARVWLMTQLQSARNG